MTQACVGLRVDKQPCAAQAMPTGLYCWFHDPELAGERLRVRRKGGENSAHRRRLQKLMPLHLVSVYEGLEEAFTKTMASEMEPRVAHALSALASAMVRTIMAGEMEARVRDLENSVQAGNRGKQWRA